MIEWWYDIRYIYLDPLYVPTKMAGFAEVKIPNVDPNTHFIGILYGIEFGIYSTEIHDENFMFVFSQGGKTTTWRSEKGNTFW